MPALNCIVLSTTSMSRVDVLLAEVGAHLKQECKWVHILWPNFDLAFMDPTYPSLDNLCSALDNADAGNPPSLIVDVTGKEESVVEEWITVLKARTGRMFRDLSVSTLSESMSLLLISPESEGEKYEGSIHQNQLSVEEKAAQAV